MFSFQKFIGALKYSLLQLINKLTVFDFSFISSMSALSRMSLGDILECRICLGHFEQPKVLPCQHTFCFWCLEVWRGSVNETDDEDMIKCPHCRKEHQIPQSGIAGFPDNFMANNLLEKLMEQGENTVCSQCSKHAELSKCVHCDDMLCSDCEIIHRKLMELDALKALKCAQTTLSAALKTVEDRRRNSDSLKNEIETKRRIEKRFDKHIWKFAARKRLVFVCLRKIKELQREAMSRIQTLTSNAGARCRDLEEELARVESAADIKKIMDEIAETQNSLSDLPQLLEFLVSDIDIDLNMCLAFSLRRFGNIKHDNVPARIIRFGQQLIGLQDLNEK